MSGSLYEGHESVAEELHASGQQQLSTFGSTGQRTVAIANDSSSLAQFADTLYVELQVPPTTRKRYFQFLAGFRTNSAVSSPQTRAFDDASVADSYQSYLLGSEEAQIAIDNIVANLEAGEDVSILFENEIDEMAYREVLSELIERRVDSQFSFTA